MPLTKVSRTAFVFSFTNDMLEKFLPSNSRHARSGEMRRRLYYGHPKFGPVRLPTNAATNAYLLNYIGQATNILVLANNTGISRQGAQYHMYKTYIYDIERP